MIQKRAVSAKEIWKLCYLGPNEKFQNPSCLLSSRKVKAQERRKVRLYVAEEHIYIAEVRDYIAEEQGCKKIGTVGPEVLRKVGVQ